MLIRFEEKKGPKVKIHCDIQDHKILKTTLVHSPLFEATIEADIASRTVDTLTKWLEHYSKKANPSAFPHELLNLDEITPFRKEVMIALCSIPCGQVLSYGEVAEKVGNEKASRAVGTACGKNPFPLLVPCHRVIASDGSLGGFSLDFRIKRDLLDFEQVI